MRKIVLFTTQQESEFPWGLIIEIEAQVDDYLST